MITQTQEVAESGALQHHPALKSFPSLTDDQQAGLKESIKAQGIQEPIVCISGGNVIDGRARLKAALDIGIAQVPVVTRACMSRDAVLAYALESRVTRGQLTKSGVALVLFNQHPDLSVAPNKGGRPLKPAGLPQVSDAVSESYAQLAKRYRVDRDLFTILGEAKRTLTLAQWSELEKKVLVFEIALGRAYAGIRGGTKMGESGRMETCYFDGWDDEALWKRCLFASSLTTVRNALARYANEDRAVRQMVKKEVVSLWSQLPDDLRSACLEELR